MKKFFRTLGILLLLFAICIGGYYFINNEALPEGKQGKEADALAIKMLNAINYEAYKNTEIIAWSFRDKNHYKWYKQEGKVDIVLGKDTILLNLSDISKSEALSPELIKKAIKNFNNDSFWLVAPYKIFDLGTERSIVKHNNKDALLITYTSGGSTPGDSYLWILDKNHVPISYKMWTSIIPIGGVSATWSNWKKTEAGIQLPTKHKLSLFGMKLSMGNVRASNPKATILAHKILKAINHNAYKNTRFLEWSFGGKRNYKWDKKNHLVTISWDTMRVNLHPNHIDRSTVFYNNKLQQEPDLAIIKKANNFFNNDSFWLVAPHKLFEDGIIRNIRKTNNKDALLVKYTKGGTTPGDSYLWILDTNYVPKSYKMYVPSMHMNGVTATWDDWIITESGALLPTSHTFSNNKKLSLKPVKGRN